MSQINAQSILGKGFDFMMNLSNSIYIQKINYTTNITGSSSYDDEITQTMIGSYWTSGTVFPIRGKQGSEESMLIEQGKLSTQDKVLYISGGATLNSSGLLIGVGSPNFTNYSLVPLGDFYYDTNAITIYKKLFIRKVLSGGSLY
jgi:hypothetical protein